MIRRVLNVLGIIIASTILLVGCSTGSKLSLDKVKTIELGDTKEQVTSILGAPAEEKLGNYEYYSGNFLSIAEEMDANTEKFLNANSLKEMEQCFEKEKQLQEKLDSTVGQYICIEFRDEKVYSIFYDNNKIGVENNSQTKVVDSYQVISGTVLKYLRTGTVVYEVSYQDGSYLKATTSATVNDSENTYTIGINVGASWKDQWKNNFEGTLKVEFNEEITSGTGFYILDNVAHIIGDNYSQINSSSSEALRKRVTEIIVEDNVKRLEFLFRFPNARKITLPNTLEYIGNIFYETEYYKAFYRYNIGGGALYYNDYLLAYQSTMYSSQEVEIKNNVRLIAAGAFSGNTRITSVVLPDSIQAIEDYTFSNCSNLVSVTIPNGVTRIGDNAFSGCISLTSINLPMSVKNIGASAFYNCVNLTNINLPNFLTSIGNSAFSNCVALTSITLPSSLTNISEDAFKECYRLVELYNLSNVVIEQGKNNYIKVTHTSLDEKSCIIEDDDFVYIKDNENIYYLIQYKGKDSKCELPAQIEDHSYEIHAGAFYGDNFICELVMPSSIKKIGDNAFSFLGSVYYDGTIEDWCSIDFADRTSMPSITSFYLKNAEDSWEQIFEIVLPETITQIKPFQFYGFEYFQGKIIVPKSVSNIGKYAIRAKKIIYLGSKEEWNRIDINEENFNLSDSVWFYSEKKPLEEGNFWHYVDGLIAVWN